MEIEVKKNETKIMKYFILGFVFFMSIAGLLINVLGLPDGIRFISDVICCILLVYLIKHLNVIIKNIKFILIPVFLFLLFSCIGFIINRYSVYQYIWGLRNYFRFFIFFFSAYIAFNKEDIESIRKKFTYLFFINVIACLIEFFIFKLEGDDIGGTFQGAGANGFLLMLLIIETTYAINNYVNKKSKFKGVFLVCLFSILIAAIAEIKAFYIFFALIVLMSMILNKKNKKVIIICIVSIAIIFIGVKALNKLFPESLLTKEYLLGYIESDKYATQKDIGRGKAFFQINDIFFKNDLKEILIGYGLGSCGTSSLSIFNTLFYNRYYQLHYSWFLHSMLFLETGLIGYILYIAFFISIAVTSFAIRKKEGNFVICNANIIISMICIVATWYNSALNNEFCFFVYMILVLPLLLNKKGTVKKIAKSNGEID